MVKKKIKVLIASTVYGYENELASIYSQLDTYKYEVMNSHMGTVYAGADKSNTDNCLDAVDECDAFLGIIWPTYGSGVIGETSITHEEVLRAIMKKKARWFLTHEKVVFARQLLNHADILDRHTLKKLPSKNIVVRPNSIIDVRCIDIYNEVTLDKVPPKERVGHWAQTFYDLPGITRFIEGQFQEPAKVQRTVDYMKKIQNGR